jgi:hypothetical protein
MIYLNKEDLGKSVYRVVQDYVVQVAYYVKAKSADEARDIALDFGGINSDNVRDMIKQDSDQLELDWYDTGFDDQTEEHLGIIINDENDQDEVMLDKYAEAV